jgi:hypothetical protein
MFITVYLLSSQMKLIIEWAIFPKTIYYTRVSDGVKLSTSGVSLQVTKQAAGQVDSTQEYIAKVWQKVSFLKGAPPTR